MPQIRQKSGFSADGQAMFGHQVGVWHHVGAAIVVVWHCMGVEQVDEHSKHDYKSTHHTFTATCWRFHASDQEKILIFCQLSDKFLGHQVGVQQHAGATIVHVWHCMGV